jgi:transcriptional regulator with XRE-family HTH domain
MDEATPLGSVIGANIRLSRDLAGLSQEQFARRVREFGLRWDRSQVAKIERGDRDFSVVELLLVSAAIDVHPLQLIDCGHGVEIALGPDVTISSDLLTKVLPFVGGKWPKPVTTRQRRDLDQVVRDAQLEVEQRAARVLGVEPAALARKARRRWGHSFGEERDDRVARLIINGDQRSARALRGLVTAELTNELRGAVPTKRRRQTP